MTLIAGTLYHYRDPELLQLLLYLRIVMDHGGFNGKVTALVQDQLVIRSIVLAGIDHLFLFHGVLCFLDIPSVFLGSGKLDAVNPVDSAEKIHGRGCYQIDIVYGLLQNRNVRIQPLRCFLAFGNYKKLSFLINGEQRIAIVVVIHIKFLCVGKLHTVVKGKAWNIRRLMFCLCCLHCKSTSQDQGQRQKYV